MFKRILVPLDGSLLSEAVFEPVAYLVAGLAYATSHQGELYLLRVIDLPYTSGRTRSQTNVDVMSKEQAVQIAEEYLKSLTARLDEGRLANLDITVKTEVESHPDVAKAIIQAGGRRTCRPDRHGDSWPGRDAAFRHGQCYRKRAGYDPSANADCPCDSVNRSNPDCH